MSSRFQPIKTSGNPPWYVFLVVNLGPKAIKQTDIRIHSDPDVIEYIQNRIYATSREIWHTVMSIGPFFVWDKALDFMRCWSQYTRGNRSRIVRGVVLYTELYQKENLQLRFTSKTKQEATQNLINKMCMPDIYGVIFDCNPHDYNLNEDKLYIPQEKLPYLTSIPCNQEDYLKLLYWSEGKLSNVQVGDESCDFTTRTLAYISEQTKTNMDQFVSTDVKDEDFISFESSDSSE